MNRPTRTDTVFGNDLAVIWRETDAGYRAVLIDSLIAYLNTAVSGSDGKSLLNGVLPPGVMDGTEGDFWIDTATWNIYGPKAGTDWGFPTSLIGPEGPQGDGVPVGGIAGQVLTKTTGWVSALAGIDSIDFDTTAGITPQEGRLSWNATDGTLNLGLKGGLVTLQVGQESVQLVKADDNGGLVEGKAYRVMGSDGANVTVLKSQGNNAVNAGTTLGVMTESTTSGNKAYMTTFGLVRDINTSGLIEGQKVYVSPTVAGDLTSTKPETPNHAVSVGYCIRSHASVGSIFVDVDTGKDLGDLHDLKITGLADGDTIEYNSALGYWENRQPTGQVQSVNGYTGVVVLGKNDIGLGSVPNIDATSPANITQSSSYRFVSDAEKTAWNAKQAALGFTPVPDTRTVAGIPLTGDITLTKTNVGLSNVDNTSDADKPVSTLQAGAIALKENALGNPATNGYVLASTVAGVRSWVASGGGGGGIPEAPVDGTTYGRKDAGWVAVSGGGGSAPRVATVAVDFLNEENEITATVVDAAVTVKSIVTVQHASEDLGIQGVQFSAVVTPGVGYDVFGYAPVGASGAYNVTAIIQEGA